MVHPVEFPGTTARCLLVPRHIGSLTMVVLGNRLAVMENVYTQTHLKAAQVNVVIILLLIEDSVQDRASADSD